MISNPLTLPAEGAIERLRETDLFVLDMDGTIYLGDRVFPEAIAFVRGARERGKRVLFFTNNASRDPETYVSRLNRMDFGVSRKDVVTSGDVTTAYLKLHHPDENVYLVGTEALRRQFLEEGVPLSEDAKIVVVSFDTELVYEKLRIAVNLIRNGAVFYSTHPDYVCPVPDGVLPDSGALCAAVSACTGVTPRYFGKPYRETADMISLLYGVPKEKTAVVGDRLYTDIALGKRNGLLSVLVLTGETAVSDLTEENRPDIVLDDIGRILPYLG